jgi:hypothetical protein
VESEYRALYSRFTGQKNRGSVRHALTVASINYNSSKNEKATTLFMVDIHRFLMHGEDTIFLDTYFLSFQYSSNI